MDIDSMISSISRHRDKINKYREEIHKKQSKINSNNGKKMDYKSKITRTKNISTIKSYYNKIATLESDNEKIQKEISSLMRKEMNEQKELNRLEKQVLNNSITNSNMISSEEIMPNIVNTEIKSEEEEIIKPYNEVVSDFCKNIKKNGLITRYGKIDGISDLGNQGGNGRVLFGNLNNHEVAIKVLFKNEKRKINRFFIEFVNVFMSLQKAKGIVELYLYEKIEYEGQDIYYIVMKKYQGNLLKNKPDLNEKNTVKLFYDLCYIIEQVHKANIIHRDIKPENILIDENNEIILSDFGIAYFDSTQYEYTGHTLVREFLGNRKFSAPEQDDKGTEPHVTMDIYALGQIIQWYVTGNTHSGTGRKELNTVINGNMMFELDRVVDKCIRFDPKERYQSINEIYNDLEKYNIEIRDEVKKPTWKDDFFSEESTYEKNDLGLGEEIVVI